MDLLVWSNKPHVFLDGVVEDQIFWNSEFNVGTCFAYLCKLVSINHILDKMMILQVLITEQMYLGIIGGAFNIGSLPCYEVPFSEEWTATCLLLPLMSTRFA